MRNQKICNFIANEKGQFSNSSITFSIIILAVIALLLIVSSKASEDLNNNISLSDNTTIDNSAITENVTFADNTTIIDNIAENLTTIDNDNPLAEKTNSSPSMRTIENKQVTSFNGYYWVGLANGNWSDASSWSSTSGGPGGLGVPDSTSDIVFDAGGNTNSIIDPAFPGVVNSVNISSGYTATVTSRLGWNSSLNVTGNFIISGGTLSHSDNSNAETYRLNINIGGDLTVDSGAVINVTGLGYDAGSGPGTSTSYYVGGSYGGKGGISSGWVASVSGPTYGSISSPVNLGSGGFVTEGTSGGGAVIINVSGSVLINGGVIANAGTSASGYGEGSGGSVYLIAQSINGSGTIDANGGNTMYGIGPTYGMGSGGGGRIAIILTSGTDFGSVTAQAFGGSTSYKGAAGTVYLKKATDTYGQLIIDNNGAANNGVAVLSTTTTLISANTTYDGTSHIYTFDSINLIRCGALEIGNSTSLLNISSTNMTGDGKLCSKLIISNFNNLTLPVDTNWNITNYALSMKGLSQGTLNKNLVINANSFLTHEDNVNSELNKINFAINGNLTVDSGGAINVTGLGYDAGSGPGTSTSYYVGGSYGGKGGISSGWGASVSGPTYGSISSPVNLGSGGFVTEGTSGGGAVIINVSGSVLINGGVIANAGTSASGYGEGSGGSVYLIAKSINGSGIIMVNGEVPTYFNPPYFMGSGGGGRISIILTSGTDFGSVTAQAFGGSTSYKGAAGTVYLKKATDTYGQLIIDNNNAITGATTQISENVTDAIVGDVQIRNSGFLDISSFYLLSNPTSLTVYGNWNITNGNFTAGINSTVIFLGSANATIYSNETFYNLNITKTGGYVFFPARWQTNISGKFAVQGNSTNYAYLRSTIDGTQWKLNQSSFSVQYADVKDSNNTGALILTTLSLDSGDNNGWDLSPNSASLTPINNSYVSNQSVNFTASLTDDVGLQNATLYIYNQTGLYASFDVAISGSPLTTLVSYFTSLVDGIYTWFWRFFDTSGNFNFSPNRTLIVDSTRPRVEIAYPLNISYNINVSSLNYTVSDTNLQSCWYSLNNGAANTTITCGTNATGLVSLEGSNTWRVYANDSTGNVNSSLITFTKDTINPLVVFYNPTLANRSYTNVSIITANISIVDTNYANSTIYVYNSTSLVNSSSYLGVPVTFYLPDGIYYVNATAEDMFGNKNSTETRSITVDSTHPQLTFIDPTPANGTAEGSSTLFYINVTFAELNFANLTFAFGSQANTICNSSGCSNANASLTQINQTDWIFLLNKTGLAAGISYYYNITVADLANNINSTETRFVLGNTAPNVTSVAQSITDNSLLDPGTNITITANITDVNDNFNFATLELRNSSGVLVTSINMTNMTAQTGNMTFNAFIMLPLTEGNYTYRIVANDIFVAGYSNNLTMTDFWDCSWTLAPADLSATAGFNEVAKYIGSVMINNTGDPLYTNNNCTLDFRVIYNLAEGRIFYDGESFKNLVLPTGSIAARTERNITLNATFLSEFTEEPVTINFTEFRARSSTAMRSVTSTLITTKGGPYLFQKITGNPTSIPLTSGNFSLESYVRDIVGDDTLNNTAFNVSSNWTLPSGFDVIQGSVNVSYDNLSDATPNYNNINITFNESNLPTISPGIVSVNLYVRGYDSSGNVIVHSGNRTTLLEQVNISLACYNASDGILVPACGSLDLDNPVATNTIINTVSGGAAGGGGGGGKAKALTKADFFIVRGKQNEIQVPFKNKDLNDSLTNLAFSVSGNIAKYIEIVPSSLSSLGPQQQTLITLKITSPTFISLGRQTIVLSIAGKLLNNLYFEDKTIVIEVHELSGVEAENLLNQSIDLLASIQNLNVSSKSLVSLINDSTDALANFNYEKVRDNYNTIKQAASDISATLKIIADLESQILIAKAKSVSVAETERTIRLSQIALEREDYSTALSRAKEAQVNFVAETKGEFGSLLYYIKTDAKQIVFGAFLLFLFSFVTYKTAKLQLIKRNIKRLRDEEKILFELMKVVQKATFSDNTMSMEEYEQAMDGYEKKISETTEELIDLESKRANALKIAVDEKSRLKTEKQRIVELIKELQSDYMQKGKMETRAYQSRLESYDKRIGEIEEKLATFEANSAMNERFGFLRAFISGGKK